MSRADIVPVETEKAFERTSPHESASQSVRDVMEAHLQDLDFEDPDTIIADAPHETQASRERDESGRFRPKAQKEDFEALQSDGNAAIEAPQAPAIESAPASAPLARPQSWAADAAEAWNQTPRRAQEEFVKRETDLRRGLQQATDKAAQAERAWGDVGEALMPFKEVIESGRATGGQIVKNFAWWQQRMDNPETRFQAFRDLLESYGHTPEQLAQVPAAQTQIPPYVREILQKQQQLERNLQERTDRERAMMVNSVASEVESFAREVDAAGQPLRPHWDHVLTDIEDWAPRVRAANPEYSNRQVLQAAYEKAIWSNPSTRELEMKRAMPQTNKQNIERARRAAKMVNGEALGPDVPESPNDIRGLMRANAAKLGM